MVIELNTTFDRLINNKKLEKREKKMTIEQLALLSKLGQNSGQISEDGDEKKKKSKHKLRLNLEDICWNCSRNKHQGRILECPKHKNKRKQGRKSKSANFAINDLHLAEKKNLDKREVGRMLIVREDTSRKELLLNYSTIAYIFDK